jgi:hypothetical protein
MLGKQSGAVIQHSVHKLVVGLVRDDVKAIVSRANGTVSRAPTGERRARGALFNLAESIRVLVLNSQVFKKYSQMKLQRRREALAKAQPPRERDARFRAQPVSERTNSGTVLAQ